MPPRREVSPSLLIARSWTILPHVEIPLRCFGLKTSGSCAASRQFPLDLVRDSEKSVLNRFRYAAQADAADASKRSTRLHSLSAFGSMASQLPIATKNTKGHKK